MASYFITGKLGSGKGLVSVGRIFDYLRQGRKVATNIDIFLSGYLPPSSFSTYMRLPDKPNLFDLEMIGNGSDKVEFDENGSPMFSEDEHGLLVLDELGSWFNSRQWQDKTRQGVLDYLIHLRKRGWDSLFIVQDIESVDKQLRGMLGEHLVICGRTDRLKIPFLGSLFRLFGFKGNLPKIHRGKVYYGETRADLCTETWTYTGRRFYKAYNTKQIFETNYPHGVHSVLSSWHIKGRFLPGQKDALNTFLDFAIEKREVTSKKLNCVVDLMHLPERERIEQWKRMNEFGVFEHC
jgi:hypothetical protein